MATPAPQPVFELDGGNPCLDFANTVSDRPAPLPRERLKSYGDLVAWGQQAGLVDRAEARHLLAEGERRPEEAAAVLRQARLLREALFRIVSAFAASRLPAEHDLHALNAALPGALAHLRLAPAGRGLTFSWARDPGALDSMLWPVVRSAAELLASEDLRAVRECAADTCGWLFLDRSKNQSRRWCDMKVCGNRSKARRHYARKRSPAKRR
jgi:predicted RNA-binding Zn ribbon-like protein